jgi:hypothetical protein
MTTPPALPRARLTDTEQLFGITLTEVERMWLTTNPELLAPYEQQHRYLLIMALQPCTCPGCTYVLCQRSAAVEPFDPSTSTPDDGYACPNCKARLTWRLGVIDAAQWFVLSPGQTVTITDPGSVK